MVVTDERIVVTTVMMQQAGMSRGAFELGVPVDPKDPSKGLSWKFLGRMTMADFDAIEEYFLHKRTHR